MYQATETATEAAIQKFIDEQGGVDTIVDYWLDEFVLRDEEAASNIDYKDVKFRLQSLRVQLVHVLEANCSDFELAENAARMDGGRDFEEFLEEQLDGK